MFGEAQGDADIGLPAVALEAIRRGPPSRGLPSGAHADDGGRERRMVSRIFASWNQLDGWLRQVDRLRHAA